MDGIAQVYDTSAAHPPITAAVFDAVLIDSPAGQYLLGSTRDVYRFESTPIIATYPGDIFVTRYGTYRVTSWWRGAGSAR